MPTPTISAYEREALQNKALTSFNGRPPRDLSHGFRILKKRIGEQVAAVYWTNLAPGNQVEIAIAPGRIPDVPAPQQVQAWLEIMRELYPAPVNVHQHETRWPTFGFALDDAIAFLNECRLLRIGMLKNDRERQILERVASRGPAEQAEARLQELREQLRPSDRQALIDLVKRARISVDDWYETKDGRSVAKPRGNMAHRFNWSFGGDGEPSLACLWHADVHVADGHLIYQGNFRSFAARLESVRDDKMSPMDHRQRARMQAPKARRLDDLVKQLGVGGHLRVILNEGDMRNDDQLGEDSSQVTLRHLDDKPWVVHRYDGLTGDYVLRRLSDASANASQPVNKSPRFVDQHDLSGSDEPHKSKRAGEVYTRDNAVRQAVLLRAQGRCEVCGAEGFLTSNGGIYLETHHVEPLSSGGVDRVWNVVGICPNHHREAHSSANREMFRELLKNHLRAIYGPDTCFEGSAVASSEA